MGGDLAPGEVVPGAIEAARGGPSLEVLLVGDEARLRSLLPGGEAPERVSVVHAPEAIGMHEHPVEALRKKRASSIAVALGLVKEGKADAFFSAGNTGACVAAASLGLARVPGVRRPAIACVIPTARGASVLIDAGANVAPKAVDLLQQAAMGAAYARTVLGAASPTTGLLNVGTEADKGTDLVREAAKLLEGVGWLAFEGYVEGHDIFRGTTDVVVTDGFTGNAVLKVAEGQAEKLRHAFEAALAAAFPSEVEGRAAVGRALAKQLDWAEYGGAPLLGVDGVVMIGHGRSDARAIRKGIEASARAAERGLAGALRAAIESLPAAGA